MAYIRVLGSAVALGCGYCGYQYYGYLWDKKVGSFLAIANFSFHFFD